MQVRIPVIPEVDDAEKGLQNRLVLIVAARRADSHHRGITLEDETRRQRVTRLRSWPDLGCASRFEPELLTADTHPDSGIFKDDGAIDPSSTWSDIENISIFIDDGHVRRVFRNSGGV